MYESYFDKLRDECYLRNRTTRTANAYISNITYFLKHTGKHPGRTAVRSDTLKRKNARLKFIKSQSGHGNSSYDADCNTSQCF